MSGYFLDLDKLTNFNLEIEMEDYLSFEGVTSLKEILGDVTLSKLHFNKFRSLHLLLDQLTSVIPLPYASFTINRDNNYMAGIDVHKNTIELSIQSKKTEVVIGGDTETKEKKGTSLSEYEIKDIEVDINYLLGLIIGRKIDSKKSFSINGRITCKCKDVVYNKYFKDISSMTSSIFNREDYEINGMSFKYKTNNFNLEYNLDARIGKLDDNETFRINYETIVTPPIKLLEIMSDLFTEMRSINTILSET